MQKLSCKMQLYLLNVELLYIIMQFKTLRF